MSYYSTGARLWVLDDNPDDLDLFRHALGETENRVPVHFFDCPREFRRVLAETQPEVLPETVLMDFHMSVTAAELLQWMRGHDQFSSIRRYVWSDTTDQSIKKRCLENGAHGYFVKPNSFTQLVAIAGQLVGSISV